MPFVAIDFGKGTQANTPYVAFSVSSSDKSRALAIYFSFPLCKQMGWEVGHRAVVLEGIDEDAGTMMIEISKQGYKLYTATQGKSLSLRISESRLQNYKLEANAAYCVTDYSADREAGILIKLPTWMTYVGRPARQSVLKLPRTARE